MAAAHYLDLTRKRAVQGYPGALRKLPSTLAVCQNMYSTEILTEVIPLGPFVRASLAGDLVCKHCLKRVQRNIEEYHREEALSQEDLNMFLLAHV